MTPQTPQTPQTPKQTSPALVVLLTLLVVALCCGCLATMVGAYQLWKNSGDVATSQNPDVNQVEKNSPTTQVPSVVENPPAAAACRDETWLNNAVGATNDVAALISVLDRDFDIAQGGQWSEPGYTVPAGSVFWTDLFDNAKALPKGVEPVRVQGGWGVYYTSVNYVIPEDNGGGRFMRLCK